MTRVRSQFRRPPLTYDHGNYVWSVENSRAATREKTALIYEDRTLTYQQLTAVTGAFADRLTFLDVQPGDRICLRLRSSLDFLVALLGCLKIRAVVVPVFPATPPTEIAKMIEATRAAFLVTDDKEVAGAEHVILGVGNRLKTIEFGLDDDAGFRASVDAVLTGTRPSSRQPCVKITPSEIALLPFSSGTTGLPKGVVLTHGNLVAGLMQFADAVAASADDVLVNFLPVSHVYGLMAVATTLSVGGTVVLHDRYNLDKIAADVKRFRGTMLFGVPQVTVDMVNNAQRLKADLETLRFINTGSAPLAPEVGRQAEREIGVRVTTGYGLTEAAPVTHSAVTEPTLIDLATVGYPVADTDIRITDPDNPETDIPDGGEGELLVRGPQVANRYWSTSEDSQRMWHRRWLRTGDLARIDDQGRVHIVGRLKTLIKYGGYSIAPAELEAVLAEHSGVADCAVIGRVDSDAGEIPVAYVVLREGDRTTAEDLSRFVAERVSPQKRVRDIAFVTRIPRSTTGKIIVDALESASVSIPVQS